MKGFRKRPSPGQRQGQRHRGRWEVRTEGQRGGTCGREWGGAGWWQMSGCDSGWRCSFTLWSVLNPTLPGDLFPGPYRGTRDKKGCVSS